MENKGEFKPDTEIVSLLQSLEEIKNLSAIDKLSISGRGEYLQLIVELGATTTHPKVKSAVFNLLNILKDKNSVPFLIKEIENKKNKPILKNLVEACWHNGLNYSQYLAVFIDLLINETDEISFEAFTVIENLEYLPADEVVKEQIKIINKFIPEASDTRKYFLEETIKNISAVLE